MNLNHVLKNKLALMLLALVSVCAAPLPAWGQFAVTSNFPTDGATRVDTAATLEFSFNAPLDTSARFPWPPGFYLGLIVIPDTLIGDPDSVALDADLKTVRVHNLHLRRDTRYVIGILGARSTSGESLDHPTVFTFTTDNVLPSAQVSGAIAYPGSNPNGAIVGLFRNLFDDQPVALSVVPAANGQYTMRHLSGGTYWPIAMKDLNKSGALEPEVGVDVFAMYDDNGDGVVDSLVVPEGGARANVNLTLSPFAPMTARQRFAAAQALASASFGEAHPVAAISSQISAAGESGIWIYLFYSRPRAKYFSVFATSAVMAPVVFTEEPPDTAALPLNWINSATASSVAENNGGREFRAAHEDVYAQAVLGSFDFSTQQPSGHAPSAITHGWNPQTHRRDKLFAGPFAARQQSLRPAWVFQYSSETAADFLTIILDALTGEIIGTFPPRGTSARFNLNAANQAMQTWAADAELVMLGLHQSQLTPQGEAAMWFFIYHSASLDSEQVVFLSNGNVLGQGSIWQPPSEIALPVDWIDSPLAMLTAESHGGSQYRAANQNVTVTGFLSRGLLQHDPQRAVWGIDYTSSASSPLTIFVDALTGVVVSVEESAAANEIPRSFALQQNYPNPFNPETVIEYRLPRASEVEISIFNLQGQKMATLARGRQTAGAHKIVWNGLNEFGQRVAAGVYLYQLKVVDPARGGTGKFTAVKKMLALR